MQAGQNCQEERVLQHQMCVLQPDAEGCAAATQALNECMVRTAQQQQMVPQMGQQVPQVPQVPLEGMNMDMNTGFDPAICEIDPNQPGCPPVQ
jgi:hypothetical protein